MSIFGEGICLNDSAMRNGSPIKSAGAFDLISSYSDAVRDVYTIAKLVIITKKRQCRDAFIWELRDAESVPMQTAILHDKNNKHGLEITLLW